MIKVVEMFKTTQGEGTRIGSVSRLIRLPTCNLNCAWCDTKNKNVRDMSIDEEALIEFLRSNPTSDVIITGGEPLNDMENLERVLYLVNNNCASDVHITIETNGTIMPSEAVFDLMGETNLWSIAPKLFSSDQFYDLNVIQEISERSPYTQLKLVVSGEIDLENAFQVLGNLREYYDPIIFQPVEDYHMRGKATARDKKSYVDDVSNLTKTILSRIDQIPNRDNYRNIRVLPQLHKLVWWNGREEF